MGVKRVQSVAKGRARKPRRISPKNDDIGPYFEAGPYTRTRMPNPPQGVRRTKSVEKAVRKPTFRASAKLDRSQIEDRRRETGTLPNDLRGLANFIRDTNVGKVFREGFDKKPGEQARLRRKLLGPSRRTSRTTLDRVVRGTYKKHPRRGGK